MLLKYQELNTIGKTDVLSSHCTYTLACASLLLPLGKYSQTGRLHRPRQGDGRQRVAWEGVEDLLIAEDLATDDLVDRTYIGRGQYPILRPSRVRNCDRDKRISTNCPLVVDSVKRVDDRLCTGVEVGTSNLPEPGILIHFTEFKPKVTKKSRSFAPPENSSDPCKAS